MSYPTISSTRYYEEEEEEYVADDWCAFGNDDESTDFDEDSCSTDKSPVDVMGFPVAAQPQGGRRRSSSAGTKKLRIGQDVEVVPDRSIDIIRRRRNRLPQKCRSLDEASKTAVARIARQHRLPRKSNSLDEDRKTAVAAIAQQHRGNQRRSFRRTHSASEEQLLPRSRRQSMAGGRTTSAQQDEADLDYGRQPERRGSKTPGGSRRASMAQGSDRVTPEERRKKSTSHRGSVSTRVEESAEDRAQRMKDLSNAFKAATISNKDIIAKTDHLKVDVLM